ncbi:unnamed protein product [Linum tenue]|uniref:TLDc domain-containing protein n=1 Tax=Linum tenue TaxID=586396 RepID=A0AAV0LML0_9ROSI|nr:unnamed protein product [Linum tenue]
MSVRFIGNQARWVFSRESNGKRRTEKGRILIFHTIRNPYAVGKKMGASSSTQQAGSSEQREAESLAASVGALPMLQNSFAKLADPQTSAIPLESLQKCFGVSYETPDFESTEAPDPSSFLGVLNHLGKSLVDEFFLAEKEGISWIEFVKGYVKCCGRMTASMSLNVLMRLFATTLARSGSPSKLEFESMDDGGYKISGYLLPADVLVLLWMSWAILWDSKTSNGKERTLFLPDVSHLALSAVVSCCDGLDGVDFWVCDLAGLEVQLPAGKFLAWALATAPSLTDCLTQFINSRLQNGVSSGDESAQGTSIPGGSVLSSARSSYLLTCGRAWAISLSLRSAISVEILKPYFPSDGDQSDEHVLYRSSVHGKGLNRFWSNVEGYHGPLLILVSATSGDTHGDNSTAKKWTIGALTQQGLENKESFYGTSATLYAICPVFHVFPPSGKEKNFVYSHLHHARGYDPHPKPAGIGFGGSMGNERLYIDEDFARVTVRHHAVDKTYQNGPLFPNQGFLQVEALISEVEVWGLGGEAARSVQTSYKKREELFTEQRRKVDLKTFSNWEDSPEKMMMDMMGDPNRVRREDR